MKRAFTAALALILITGLDVRSGEQEFRAFDGFDGKLALGWQPVRPDPTHVSLTKNPGKLTITTQLGGIFADALSDPLLKGIQARNLYLIRNPATGGDFVVTTCLESFAPTTPYQQAGLMIYDDDDNYAKWGVEYNGRTPSDLAYTAVAETNQRPQIQFVEEAKPKLKQHWLRVTKRGKSYEYAFGTDGKEYTIVGESVWSYGAPRWIGLYAKNGGEPDAGEVDAHFDLFEMRSLNAAEKSDARYAERGKLQGTWEVVSCRVSGKLLENAPFARFAFSDDTLVITEKTRSLATEYRLDVTKKPKQILMSTFAGQPGRSVRAAYSLEAGTLVVCLDPRPGAQAPTELETNEGDGRWLVTLKHSSDADKETQETTQPVDS